MAYQMTGTQMMRSGKCISTAMWEYAWLLQRDGRQDEYADWDKVLDEVVERGYQSLRIDAFPHQIARGKDGKIIDEFEHIPDYNFSWTKFEPVKYNPRRGLVEFVRKCRDRGIYVGLSSWFRHDTTHRELEIETAEDYARIWIETLDLLAENDLLDAVLWVDLCNEFPITVWCPALKEILFEGIDGQTEPRDELYQKELKPESIKRFSDFMSRAIAPVRARYPELLYTFSIAYDPAFKIADYSCCDLIDLHIWSVHEKGWGNASGYYDMMAAYQTGNHNMLEMDHASKMMKHVETCCHLYPRYKEQIRDFFERELKEWGEKAKRENCLIITTESWASVVYEDVYLKGACGEWNWVEEVAEMAIGIAKKNGWTACCTSNFCEPQYEGMWYDVPWHQYITRLIQS